MKLPKDRNGRAVKIGSRVRLLGLSGNWFDTLPDSEKENILSMVGEVFEVEEIDEYGYPWIRKSWHDIDNGTCYSHSIALESYEMELAQHESPL